MQIFKNLIALIRFLLVLNYEKKIIKNYENLMCSIKMHEKI